MQQNANLNNISKFSLYLKDNENRLHQKDKLVDTVNFNLKDITILAKDVIF